MTSAIDRPYRGSGFDPPADLPIPPARMPLLRHWQLRKNWHYVSFWSPQLSLCAASASVGPLKQHYWGIWDRSAKEFREGNHIVKRPVKISADRLEVNDAGTIIDISFPSTSSFEVYRPANRAYIWSHKDYSANASGTVTHDGTTLTVGGVMFVDVNAGYHERQTRWRWAAGAGLDKQNRLIAFNAIEGLFDTPNNSERTIWIDGAAQEVGPTKFTDDLSAVSFTEGGTLRFEPEALIEKHDNYLVVRSDYFHWFGTFSGTLPGGIELGEAHGVMENHNALW